jgi:hypothetical protein
VKQISLNGKWRFALNGSPEREIVVPSAWEASCEDKVTAGPAIYRRRFVLPKHNDARCAIRFDAISFAARVKVNDCFVGEHFGMWSPFEFDITHCAREGENMLEVEVWKPGERYPLRETLAGFLPDVCTAFGGIWQNVTLRCFDAAIRDLRIFADAKDFAVRVLGRLENFLATKAIGRIDICEGDATLAFASIQTNDDGSFEAIVQMPNTQHWQPDQPKLFHAVVMFQDSNGKTLTSETRSFGFRHIETRGEQIVLNNKPTHLRGVLDWGWDEKRLCPALPHDDIESAFQKARSLGFNFFKLCLHVPNENLFEVADATGMFLWVELPMWLPSVSPALRERAVREYDAILARLHHHPSIVVVSLGCELDASVDSELLNSLRTCVRRWTPNVLLCDNSGSSEAYDGAREAQTDFHDYHFYCDLHDFDSLLDHFSRSYSRKPWLFGEFCDADTLRDFSSLSPAPFWLREPLPNLRDEIAAMRDHESRLASLHFDDGGKTLTALARSQATEIRKCIVEKTRKRFATGGYVLTGWKDTPITTSGVVDDRGELKFDPNEWSMFNADRVLILDRARRRRWTFGGDRPARRDGTTWWSDEPLALHLVLSNGGDAIRACHLRWALKSDDVQTLTSGEELLEQIESGKVSELLALQILPPCRGISQPVELEFSAALLRDNETIARNHWRLLIAPSELRSRVESMQRIHGLDEAIRRANEGENILCWLREPDPRVTDSLPFWREAIHLVDDDLIPKHFARIHRFGIATDFAIDLRRFAQLIGAERIKNLWRRIDARRMVEHSYVLEAMIGRGVMTLTTLRFAGGLGAQPDALMDNPFGAWVLSRMNNRFA